MRRNMGQKKGGQQSGKQQNSQQNVEQKNNQQNVQQQINQQNSNGQETLQQKAEKQKAYNAYVKQVTPTHSLPLNMAKAFVTGGIICTIGQFILNTCENLGLEKEIAGSWCSLILILISVLLTGFNIYPSIANWGGAGALVPITGFANGVAAPAIEFQKEGQVFGIGCKIFTIAGPVILYGIFSSWVLGLIYWIGKYFGWF